MFKKILCITSLTVMSVFAAEIPIDNGIVKVKLDTFGGSVKELTLHKKSLLLPNYSFTERVVANKQNGTEREVLLEIFEKLDYKLVEQNRKAAVTTVTFSARGIAAFNWLRITKTYRFSMNSPSFKIEYQLENLDKKEHAAGVWTRTFLRRCGDGNDMPNTIYQPREKEIKELTHPGTGISMDEWSLNPSHAWLAVEGKADQYGAIVVLPQDLLSACYSWFDPAKNNSTLEWFLRQQKIPAGGKVHFTIEVSLSNHVKRDLKRYEARLVAANAAGEKLWIPDFHAGKTNSLKVSQEIGSSIRQSEKYMNLNLLRQYFDCIQSVRLPATVNPKQVSVCEIVNGQPDDSALVPFNVTRLASGEYQVMFKVPGFNYKGAEWVKFDKNDDAWGTDGTYLGKKEYKVQIALDRAPEKQAAAFDFSGGPDLIYNGSFTKQASYGDWPTGFFWGWAFRNRKWYQYKDGVITMTRPSENDWTAFWVTVRTRGEEKLTVSYRVRNDDRANGIARSLITFYDRDGKELKKDSRELYRAAKSHDWQEQKHTFYVPKGAASAKFSIQLFGIKDQQVSIDDLKVIPEDIPYEQQSKLERMRDQTKNLWYKPLDSMERISHDYVTSHKKWLKPSAFEMPEALFLPFLHAELESPKRRTIVELAQRMDISYRYIPLLIKVLNIPFGTMGVVVNEMVCANELEPYTIECLKELKQLPEVIIVQGVNFKKHVKAPFLNWLASAQKKNSSVLFINCIDIPEQFLGQKVERPAGMMLVPEMRQVSPQGVDEFLSVYRNGSNRNAVLCYSKYNFYYNAGLLPFSMPEQRTELVPAYISRDFPYWEYTYLPMMKTLRWLAGKKSDAEFNAFSADGNTMTFQVNATGNTVAELEIAYKDLLRQTLGTAIRKIQLQPGGNSLRIPLPKLPGGSLIAEYRLLNPEKKVLDAGASHLKLPEVSPLTLRFANSDRIFPREQKIGFTVTAPRAIPQSMLKVRIEDTDFRTVYEDIRKTEAVNEFKIQLHAPYTKLYRVMVDQISGKDTVSTQFGEFALSGCPFDPKDLTAMIWHGIPEMTPILKDLGFDMAVTGYAQAGLNHRNHANLNMESLAIGSGHEDVTNHSYRGDKSSDPVRIPCYSDPERHRKVQKSFRQQSEKQHWSYYSLRHHFLGDEMFLGSSVCYSPYCLKAFREVLKKQYGSLDHLNKEWETAFRNWDEVVPCQLQELKNKNNLSRWLDHKMFMTGVFAHQNVGAIRNDLNEIVPGVRCGMSGTQLPGYSYDWAQLMKKINFIAYYDGVQTKLVHDFGGPELISGQWGCGYVDPTVRRDQYQNAILWRDLFRGANMAAAYACGSTINGDMSLNSNIEVYSKVFREMKQGLARMTLSANPANENVAVLYSQPSLFAAMGSIGLPEWQNAYAGWNALLEDSHVNFRFLSYEMLMQGIDNHQYNVLILPAALALSPVQGSNLETFVRNGGTVIADFMPGCFDEHGKRFNNARLASLFGVTSTDMEISLIGKEISIEADPANGIPAVKGNFRIGSTSAPVMKVNRIGKGKAILMNLMVNGYQATILTGVGGERATQVSGAEIFCRNLRQLVNGMLHNAGVPGRCTVTLADGQAYPCQTMLRNSGDNYVFGIMKFTESGNTYDMTQGADVTVKLPVRGHIYNVREKKYLGYADTIHSRIVPAWGYLYTILKNKIRRVEINAPLSVKRGSLLNIEFNAVTEKGDAGSLTYHISLLGPDGKTVTVYDRNVCTLNGKGQAAVQTAFNDPSGKWTIRVTNVNTGITAVKIFELE